MWDIESAAVQTSPSRDRERAACFRDLRRRVAGAACPPLPGIVAACIVLLVAVSPLRAEHAVIDLRIIGPESEVSAGSDQEPPVGGVNPRPLLKVHVGDPLVLQFILTNVYPHGRIKGVKVRYYVVRVDKVRQKTVPALEGEGVIALGEMGLNFKPKCRVGARMRLRVPEPGIYMVRVETLNTQTDHEHFSSIDLEVVK